MKKKKKKNKTNKVKKSPSDAKGLFILAFDILLFLSFISFVQGSPSSNFLGIIGYYSSFFFSYLFGFGSYLIFIYIGWIGWKFLTCKAIISAGFKSFCFASLLICSCILLNVIAENIPETILFLEKHIIKETVIFYEPYPHGIMRLNFGGVPFYYLYYDLPYFNLQKLLSNVGVVLIFSITGFVSFLLFANIQIIQNFSRMARIFSYLYHKGRSLLITTMRFIGMCIIKLFCLIFAVPRGIKALVQYISMRKTSYFTKKIKTKNLPKQNLSEVILSHENMFSSKDITTKKTKKQDKKISNTFKTATTSPSSDNKRVRKYVTKEKNDTPLYEPPPSALLSNPPAINQPLLKKELKKQSDILYSTLKSFGIETKVGNINCGPTITSFEVHPQIGVKVQKIKALENDIALNLQAKTIRIIAPIPGKAAVGVEIPSLYPQTVTLKEMHLYYQQMKKQHIPLLLGKTVSGEYVVTDLTKMPHCLIAGATGSGKSVCINTIVMSIVMNSHPDEVKLLMVDPKKVELTQYSQLPHMIAPVITESHGAYAALQWLVREMNKRYDILKQLGVRNITAFNSRKIKKDVEKSLSIEVPKKMPYILCIIDEFADLMMVSSGDLETPIARIAQMARAVGIHLLLATQRPSREVITGIIKANFPSRIAFKVASRINSQIILDDVGAETLLGNGDMLFLPPGTSHLVRAQGAFISDEDIFRIVTSICVKYRTSYIVPSFDNMSPKEMLEKNGPKDKLYHQAALLVVETRNASTTFLQRKLKIGYARAASLMDELEENQVIGPPEGGKPRRIFASKESLLKKDGL
jgi:DNA segregation ATPase FtsK/SpoIIIE, S-DNA-T family